MSGDELRALLADGGYQQVVPDPEAARAELSTARLHLQSASLIAPSDPTGAFAIGWEAIRKAASAHMRANGCRVRRGPGGHERIGRYVRVALRRDGIEDHLRAVDELRLLRNQSQYDGLEVEPVDVDDLLMHARAIVGAIGHDLGL